MIDSSYANPGTKYYGPHKRYDYWFTGQNSEVLQYEQTMDNSYFNVALDSGVGSSTSSTGGNNNTSQTGAKTAAAGSGNGSNGPTTVAKAPNKRTNQPRIGKLADGMEAQNNYLTSLYDPGAYAVAKITILGDPDFLIQDSPSTLNQVYSRFYGNDGYTINANGGQVFIEIDFKEAVDYNNDSGLMDINSSILFWKYPENISKQIHGVSYMVTTVSSTFSGGKFKQLIEATVNTFGDTSTPSDGQARPPAAPPPTATRATSETKGAQGEATYDAMGNVTGFTQDNPSNQSKPATTCRNDG